MASRIAKRAINFVLVISSLLCLVVTRLAAMPMIESAQGTEECSSDCSPQENVQCRLEELEECPSPRDPQKNEDYLGPPSSLAVNLRHVSPHNGTHIHVAFRPPINGTHQYVDGYALEEIYLPSAPRDPTEVEICYIYNTSGTVWTPENSEVEFTRSCDTFYEQNLMYTMYTLPRLIGDDRIQQAVVTIKKPYFEDVAEAGNWLFQSVIYNNSCQKEVIVEFHQMLDEYKIKKYHIYLLKENSDLCLTGDNCDRLLDHTPGQKMQRVVFDHVKLGENYKVQIKADDPYASSPNTCLCQSRCSSGSTCIASNSAVFSMPVLEDKVHPKIQVVTVVCEDSKMIHQQERLFQELLSRCGCFDVKKSTEFQDLDAQFSESLTTNKPRNKMATIFVASQSACNKIESFENPADSKHLLMEKMQLGNDNYLLAWNFIRNTSKVNQSTEYNFELIFVTFPNCTVRCMSELSVYIEGTQFELTKDIKKLWRYLHDMTEPVCSFNRKCCQDKYFSSKEWQKYIDQLECCEGDDTISQESALEDDRGADRPGSEKRHLEGHIPGDVVSVVTTSCVPPATTITENSQKTSDRQQIMAQKAATMNHKYDKDGRNKDSLVDIYGGNTNVLTSSKGHIPGDAVTVYTGSQIVHPPDDSTIITETSQKAETRQRNMTKRIDTMNLQYDNGGVSVDNVVNMNEDCDSEVSAFDNENGSFVGPGGTEINSFCGDINADIHRFNMEYGSSDELLQAKESADQHSASV